MSKNKSTLNFIGIKSGGIVKAENVNTNYDPAAATTAAHNHDGSVDRETNITLMDTAKGTDVVNFNSDLTGKGIGFKYADSRTARVASTKSVPSTAQATEKAGVYNSLKRPGQVLVINNRFSKLGRKINPSVDRDRYKELLRPLAESDGITVNTLFTKTLGLGDDNVVVEENVDAGGLLKLLTDHKKDCIDNDSGFSAIVIMSHGGSKRNSIFMDDLQEIDLFKDILVHFNHTNFDQFVGKPKLFFVQAFESLDYNFGDLMDTEMDVGGYSNSGNTNDAAPDGEVASNALALIPSGREAKRPRDDLIEGDLEDTFVSRPSLPFRAALKDYGEGSVYIRFLSEILGDIGTTADLKEVHEQLRQKIVEPVLARKDLQDKYGRFRNATFYDNYKFSKLFSF